MAYQIILAGVLDGQSPFSEADILELLERDSAALKHGATFTGRPSTTIYASEQSVCKIRTEIRLDPRSALRWVHQALAKEQLYRVHHPHKTWFVASDPEAPGEPPLIGNICPRLAPLHDVCQSPLDTGESPDTRIRYLEALLAQYCRVAAQHQVRLDEGLSNFGADRDGQVYYLDDDIYNWDRFVSCAQMLGVYFRALQWLEESHAAHLGERLREFLQTYFGDTQYAIVLAEQLRDVFIPNEPLRQRLDVFIDALTKQHNRRMQVYRGFSEARYIALLADIHGNLPALDVVLAFLHAQNIHHTVVLGDIVGYGPYPAECIERLRTTDFMIVKGNHDQGLAYGNYQKGFSQTARWALEWSEQHVRAEHKAWLADLPPVLHGEGWLALHGAPMDPTFFNAYVYEMTYERNLDYMQEKKLPLCFHGHTHLSGVYARRQGRMDKHYNSEEVDLKPFDHVLICPGSIGQPRDYRAGAQFAVYDMEQRSVRFHVLPYNLEQVIGKMKQENFPQTLINILRNTH